MAIDSLFERGDKRDWQEFASVLRDDKSVARDALFMCDHHANIESAALARVLIRHFYGDIGGDSLFRGKLVKTGGIKINESI